MTPIQFAAQQLIDRGMRLVRLESRGKRPVSKAWQNTEPSADEFRASDNVGVQLGSKSGHLVDVDLDIPEARALSGLDCFFGHLPYFHRQSLPASAPGHRLVICPDAPERCVAFGFSTQAELNAIVSLKLPKTVILELRAGRGCTVFPPSVLGGDSLVWGPGHRNLPTMKWSVLHRLGAILAVSALAAACYPEEGSRDKFCMLLAGALIELGVEPQMSERIICGIATTKEDTEPRGGKAFATLAKREEGLPVTKLRDFLVFVGLEACERRIRHWFGLNGSLPTRLTNPPDEGIDVGNTNLVQRTNLIEEMFIRNSVQLFRRGSEIVRVQRLEHSTSAGGETWRHEGMVGFTRATAEWLAIQASSLAPFYRRNRGGGITFVAPSPALMEGLHQTVDERHFPVVLGLSLTPTLSRFTPGYDLETGLVLVFKHDAYPPMPASPSRDDAIKALHRLALPLREFPFADDGASRSVALSALLTGVIRGQLRTSPLHVFTAPTAGTGKTKLAECVGLLATGVLPSGMNYSPHMEENEKRLTSVLRSGDPVVLIDNITGELAGDALCSVLTAGTVQSRTLGASEMVHLSTRVLILATGNNLRLRGDLPRRAVACYLDAKTSNPEDRKFSFDPIAEIRSQRGQLVVDALTILRAYRDAGQPVDLPALGSFEDWDLVRGALLWLGEADPASTKARLKSDSSDIEEHSTLLRKLLQLFGTERRFTIAELSRNEGQPGTSEICSLLQDSRWDARRAGRLLVRHLDRPFCGITLRSLASSAGVRQYWLEGQPDPDLASEIARL
jgi:hypothetical protein